MSSASFTSSCAVASRQWVKATKVANRRMAETLAVPANRASEASRLDGTPLSGNLILSVKQHLTFTIFNIGFYSLMSIRTAC